MNAPRVISIGSKWLILSAVLIFVLAGLALTFWAGIFSPAEERIERIHFASCEWARNSASGNVEATLHIANTGAKDIVISKVSINETLLSSAEWECFPSLLLKPADQGYIQVTPTSVTINRGATYMFTLETTARNVFSYSSIAGAGEGQTQQAGVMLVKENVSWPTSSSIAIVIRNTGTSNGKITAVYVGTSGTNLTSATVSSPSLPATVNAGASQSFTITYTWDANTRYYFKFSTDTPATLEFSEKSP